MDWTTVALVAAVSGWAILVYKWWQWPPFPRFKKKPETPSDDWAKIQALSLPFLAPTADLIEKLNLRLDDLELRLAVEEKTRHELGVAVYQLDQQSPNEQIKLHYQNYREVTEHLLARTIRIEDLLGNIMVMPPLPKVDFRKIALSLST